MKSRKSSLAASSPDSDASVYTGRFAPSPTGPLHQGSLLAAMASYLDARANQGRWLVRMEDLDPPRESPAAAATILQQLTDLGLHWDGEVLYQSERHDAYEQALESLQQEGKCFPCDCTRAQIRKSGDIYPGTCRNKTQTPNTDYAIRLLVEPGDVALEDRIQGHYQQDLATDVGDFVIQRKDGFFAYQLAVVVDDAFQHVNQVVRGMDLLDSTPRQIYLQRLLGLPTPSYAHVPVIVNAEGDKLSKQTFATAVDTENALDSLHSTLHLLGQQPPSSGDFDHQEDFLDWAIAHWDIQAVPKLANISGYLT